MGDELHVAAQTTVTRACGRVLTGLYQSSESALFGTKRNITVIMALLVDKHRPRTLETLSYHPELTERLRSLAASGDFPHLLIYGPSGAGKKTRITATLRALYGPGVEKIKIDSRVFQTTR